MDAKYPKRIIMILISKFVNSYPRLEPFSNNWYEAKFFEIWEVTIIFFFLFNLL